MTNKVKKELKEKMLDLRKFCKENKIEYLSVCTMVEDDYVSFTTKKETVYKFGEDKWYETKLEKV